MAIEFGNGTSLSNVLSAEWRIHTNFTGNQSPIANNWERADTSGKTGNNYANVLTESSGVFSFTHTGWYTLSLSHYSYGQSIGCHWCEMSMQLSSNSGSNYSTLGKTQGFVLSSYTMYQITTNTLNFKVANTSTYRMRFHVNNENSNLITAASTNSKSTGFSIIKVADI
tara:strand:+ start:24 stop:530 length:507 start_codon:yes stop_codon:yes gene_type:complete